MTWIPWIIIVLLLIAYSVGEIHASKWLQKSFTKYTYALEKITEAVGSQEIKIDILILEVQALKLSIESNTETSKNASARVNIFGNQLDSAFKYHKEEVADLLNRLQAKTTSEYLALDRARMSPEDFMKFKLNQEESRKRQENPAWAKQQREISEHKFEVLG